MPILDQLIAMQASRKSPLEMLKDRKREILDEQMAMEQLSMRRQEFQAQQQEAQQKTLAAQQEQQAVAKAAGYMKQAITTAGEPDYSKALKLAYADGDPTAIDVLIKRQKEAAESKRQQIGVGNDITAEQRAQAGEVRAQEDQRIQRAQEGRAANEFGYNVSLRDLERQTKEQSLINSKLEAEAKRKAIKEGGTYKPIGGEIDNTTVENILSPEFEDMDLPKEQENAAIGTARLAYTTLVSEQHKKTPQEAWDMILPALRNNMTDGGIGPDGSVNLNKFNEELFGPKAPQAPTATAAPTANVQEDKRRAALETILNHPEATPEQKAWAQQQYDAGAQQ